MKAVVTFLVLPFWKTTEQFLLYKTNYFCQELCDQKE